MPVTSPAKRYDALVIGSGAAGSIAVKQLTERGMDVLLLEAGRDITEADFTPPRINRPRPAGIGLRPRMAAALRGQPIQARRAFFNPGITPFLVNDLENPYTTPRGEFFLWVRGRQLGGRLHSYGRMLLRMSDYDFKAGSRDGASPDWPLTYSELEPYYDQVEEMIGIYGNADHLPHLPDGRYCGKPMLTSVERDFKAKVEAHWPDRHVISWRYAAPNPQRVPLGIVAARKTGRLTTRTDAVVSRITVDRKSGRADGAVYVDRHTKLAHTAQADVVFLCASAIESIRLLLNSATDGHSNGLANSSGLLGRYFMDQTPSLVFGSVPGMLGFEADNSAPKDAYYSAAGGVFIPRFHNLDQRTSTDFPRGFSVQGAMGRVPVAPDQPAAFGMMGFGEILPNEQSRVTLDPRKRDRWGVPAPHIHIALTDSERAQMKEQVRSVREMIEYSGYRVNFAGSALGLDSEDVWPDEDPVSRYLFRREFRKSVAVGAAIHECGGARMGNDPASSVLNPFNQSWDVPNLVVTDGSAFVTSGAVGPTLTIMALTARACDHVAEEHAAGRL